MNVRELIDELENYGDHLEVTIIANFGDKEYVVDGLDFFLDRVQLYFGKSYK